MCAREISNEMCIKHCVSGEGRMEGYATLWKEPTFVQSLLHIRHFPYD